jgi:hypothetical protein
MLNHSDKEHSSRSNFVQRYAFFLFLQIFFEKISVNNFKNNKNKLWLFTYKSIRTYGITHTIRYRAKKAIKSYHFS